MCAAEGCVIDLDGTVYVGREPVPGVADAIERLRGVGVPLCFATNTTRRPRSELVSRLASIADLPSWLGLD
jgi:ribonucleotide monophosphatase NagD (HAD superfamily)